MGQPNPPLDVTKLAQPAPPAVPGAPSGPLPTNQATPVPAPATPPPLDPTKLGESAVPAPTGGLTGGLVNGTPVPNPAYDKAGATQAAIDFSNASAGGWKFDPEQMSTVVKELEGHLQSCLENVHGKLPGTYTIQAPGNEVASMDFATKANQAAINFSQTHQNATSFLKSYITVLNQIKTAYANSDHASLESIKQLGRGALEQGEGA